MSIRPEDVLGVPKPDWKTDDVVMLQDMASKFLEAEVLPHYDRFEKQEIFDRSIWELAGENGLLCASMPEEYGGAGGNHAPEKAIPGDISHGGVDGFGIDLHQLIVFPYILQFRSGEAEKKWVPKMGAGGPVGHFSG